MKNTIKSFTLGLLFLFLISSCSQTQRATKIEKECFSQIISVLDSAAHYKNIRDSKVEEYKKNASSSSVESAYFYNKLLVENYMYFNLDSVQVYIDRNLALAEKAGKEEWMIETMITQCDLMSREGMLEECAEMLRNIGLNPLKKEQKLDYYIAQINYWSNRAIFLDLPLPDPMCVAYSDSIIAIENNENSPYFLYAKYWNETNPEKKEAVRDLIKKHVDEMPSTQYWYPILCMNVGWLSSLSNDTENELIYYTKGICEQIARVDRSVPMLPAVARRALEVGELETAQRLYSAVIAIQQDYPDRIRSANRPFYPALMNLSQVSLEKIKEQARYSSIISWILALCLLVAVWALYSVMVSSRKRRQLHEDLEEKMKMLHEKTAELEKERALLHTANEALSQKGTELQEEGERLREANFLKEEYIGQMFATCSAYLQKMADLKKDINRKLVARQYEMALTMTHAKSDKDIEEQHELWNKFDEIFLQLFPDFVEQFNTLLRPEEQIVPRSGEKLSTDLRIYALVRLGISSSVKIGKILGLSTQTVYNARQKMRARATESSIEFPVRVRNLCGNLQIPTLTEISE